MASQAGIISEKKTCIITDHQAQLKTHSCTKDCEHRLDCQQISIPQLPQLYSSLYDYLTPQVKTPTQ